VTRINLLPQRREAKGGGPDLQQGWILAVLGVVVAEIVALFLFHQVKREELAKQIRTNNELTSQIEQIKKTVANHAEIKAQLETLRAREDAISKLQQARTGPTAVLLELSRVLTSGHGPTIEPDALAQLRRDNPTAAYNPGWDPKRLWLTTFQETDRVVRIQGLARDGDDVSELARRLTLSMYFTDLKLLPASKTTDSETKVDLIGFQLQAKMRY
jgi:type IV pilus assembly protein PilN